MHPRSRLGEPRLHPAVDRLEEPRESLRRQRARRPLHLDLPFNSGCDLVSLHYGPIYQHALRVSPAPSGCGRNIHLQPPTWKRWAYADDCLGGCGILREVVVRSPRGVFGIRSPGRYRYGVGRDAGEDIYEGQFSDTSCLAV